MKLVFVIGGLALIALVVLTGAISLLVPAAALMVIPHFVTLSEKADEPFTSTDAKWALESARHLPGHEHLARALTAWVSSTRGYMDVPPPWEPSSAEEVEAMIEDAERRDGQPSPLYAEARRDMKIGSAEWERARRDELKYLMGGRSIDDVPGELGTDEWARNRLAQLKAGATPRFSDKVMLLPSGARYVHGTPAHRRDIDRGIIQTRKYEALSERDRVKLDILRARYRGRPPRDDTTDLR